MAFSNPPKSSANRDEKIPGSPFKASTSSPESSDKVTKFEFLQKKFRLYLRIFLKSFTIFDWAFNI